LMLFLLGMIISRVGFHVEDFLSLFKAAFIECDSNFSQGGTVSCWMFIIIFIGAIDTKKRTVNGKVRIDETEKLQFLNHVIIIKPKVLLPGDR
jgi:hypothetical protein